MFVKSGVQMEKADNGARSTHILTGARGDRPHLCIQWVLTGGLDQVAPLEIFSWKNW